MITLQNLSASFGAQVLFSNVNMQFDIGKRYGLIGANGCGKSTLLKIMMGDETANGGGSVIIPKEMVVGVLSQDQFEFDHLTVLDTVISGKKRLFEALQKRDKLIASDDHSEKAGFELAEIEEVISKEDGYQAEAQASRLISGLGIEFESHRKKMSELSGGYKLRILLARTLFEKPDILLLDEPTNHLDIHSIEWLQNFLANEFRGLLIVISHDRLFLNQTCTHIADVDYGTIQQYTGSYEDFFEAKLLAVEQKMKESQNVEKKVAQLEAFVTKFKAKASKAKQAQSKAKQIEKMDIPELLQSSRRYPNFDFSMKRKPGQVVLRVKDLQKSYGDQIVFKNLNIEINRGEKVAIIGANGLGKSTFLKSITEEHKVDSGTIEWGHETVYSYFAQDHQELLKEKCSMYDWLFNQFPMMTIGQIRGALGKVLFSGDAVDKNIQSISGGEAARLLIAAIMLKQANIIILDEPTNHLDLESITALEQALVDYDGTVILVSHDRKFISNIATKIIEILPDGYRTFDGTFHDYSDKFLQKEDESTKTKSTKEKAKASSGKEYHAKRKKAKGQINKLLTRIKNAEKEIETVEHDLQKIDATFSDSRSYANLSPSEIKELQTKKEVFTSTLEDKMQEWETAQDELKKLEDSLKN